MSVCDACVTAGEICPQCQQADLRPYGNGSKWTCPHCYFILPCCEGGELTTTRTRGEVSSLTSVLELQRDQPRPPRRR